MNTKDAIIKCEAVTKRFGELVAVNNLDLEVYRGECFALLGPNGAGKTTTMEMIEGLQRPDDGKITMLDESDARNKAVRERMGVVLQRNSFPDKVTVSELLSLFRSFYKEPLSIEKVLETVQLQDKANAFAERMSGGQQQRLAIGCALIGNPKILFLDEPSTGLDPSARREVWEILRDFKKRGNTVFFSTHYMEEAELLADRVGIMEHGKIMALDTPLNLIRSLGAEHVLRLELQGSDSLLQELSRLPSVGGAHRLDGYYLVRMHEPHVSLPAVMNLIHQKSLTLNALHTRHASLEDVFLNLTGRKFEGEVA